MRFSDFLSINVNFSLDRNATRAKYETVVLSLNEEVKGGNDGKVAHISI